MAASVYNFVRCFGFRKNIRTYEQHELLGNVALVVGVGQDYIKVVTHDLYRVEYLELLVEDFFKTFVMDPYTTPLMAAKELRNSYRTMLVPVPPVKELVEQLINNPPSLKDFTVNPNRQKTAKKALKVRESARACADFNRRTCIEIFRDDDHVHYIPLDNDGLEVENLSVEEFDKWYKPLENYPVDKAAKLYSEYSLHLGASREAMQQLAKLTPILDREIEMATAKKAANSKAKAAVKPAAAKKSAPKKTPAKPGKPAATKTAAAKSGEKRESAAQMFQDLIMEGKLTDDQIFEKVKTKYDLDEKKRGYVKWYRNHLKKSGKKPPEAKE